MAIFIVTSFASLGFRREVVNYYMYPELDGASPGKLFPAFLRNTAPSSSRF